MMRTSVYDHDDRCVRYGGCRRVPLVVTYGGGGQAILESPIQLMQPLYRHGVGDFSDRAYY